jgi:hypothetical protein
VRGNVSAVIDKVDDALGKMVPILIGFLADLVGLGGIGQKVREIVEKLQKPINKAVDFIIGTGLKLAAPIIRGLTGISSRVKAKVAAGKAWAKGKVAGAAGGLRGIRPSAQSVVSRPFDLAGHGHTASVHPNGRVVLQSSPLSPQTLVAEVRRLTRTMKEFRAARPLLEERMKAVLDAERAVVVAPAEGKNDALRNLTDAVTLLLSTTGKQPEAAGGRDVRIPGIGMKPDALRSVSTSHYDVEVGGIPISGTSTATSKPITETRAEGEPEDSAVIRHEIGMPISLVTLRADDEYVLGGHGAPKATKKLLSEPDHWRGHDSELKLLEEIAYRVRPHLRLPASDFDPTSVKSPEVTGRVWVHSDFVICPSCLNAIWNFVRRFPNVKLVVTSSNRLTPAAEARARSSELLN